MKTNKITPIPGSTVRDWVGNATPCIPRSWWAVTVYLHRSIAPVVLTLCATRGFAERVARLARGLGYINPEIVFWDESEAREKLTK